jgi:hypothetical protein
MRGLRAHLMASLFPDTPRGRASLGRLELATLVAALLALAVILQLARLGWSTSFNSLWAEDGSVYMQKALTHGFWHAVTTTYATYLVVVPRLIAEAASLAPLREVPAVVSILSAGVVGLSGLAVWQASAAHIRNPYLRGMLAALTVLSPVAGLEAITSAAYVPWYMLFATFWLLIWHPATTRGTVFASAFVLLTGLSTPGVLFFAPLVALRAVAARDRRDGAILASFGVGAAVQIPVLAFNQEQAVEPAWTHDIWTTYLQRVIDGAPLGLRLGGNAWEHLGWPLLIVLVLAGIVGLLAGFRRSGAGARWIAAIAILTSLTMFVITLYERAAAEQMVWPEGIYLTDKGNRYAIVPALLLVSAALVLIDSASRRRPAPGRFAWASAATVALLAVALVTSFPARNFALRGDPPWDAALEEAAKECTTEGVPEIAIQTSPPGWGIWLPCDRIASFAPERQ